MYLPENVFFFKYSKHTFLLSASYSPEALNAAEAQESGSLEQVLSL